MVIRGPLHVPVKTELKNYKAPLGITVCGEEPFLFIYDLLLSLQIAFFEINPFPLKTIASRRIYHRQQIKVGIIYNYIYPVSLLKPLL